MKILLVSEGKHEAGQDGRDGALARIVQRLLQVEIEFTFKKVSDRSVNEIQPMPGKAAAYEKRLLMWLRYAEKNNYEAIALVIDHDGYDERNDGIEAVQATARFSLPRAMGLAIRTFDAWIIADETAWSQLAEGTANRPQSPEEIKNPKQVCADLRDELEIEGSMSDVYAAVADKADLDRIAERCPKGFAPFKQRIEALN